MSSKINNAKKMSTRLNKISFFVVLTSQSEDLTKENTSIKKEVVPIIKELKEKINKM